MIPSRLRNISVPPAPRVRRLRIVMDLYAFQIGSPALQEALGGDVGIAGWFRPETQTERMGANMKLWTITPDQLTTLILKIEGLFNNGFYRPIAVVVVDEADTMKEVEVGSGTT